MTPKEIKNKDIYFKKMAKVYRAFSHPKRLEIVFILIDGEESVYNLLKILRISKSNLSQHIALLKKMNFVKTRQGGRFVFCRISDEKFAAGVKVFRQSWNEGKIGTHKQKYC